MKLSQINFAQIYALATSSPNYRIYQTPFGRNGPTTVFGRSVPWAGFKKAKGEKVADYIARMNKIYTSKGEAGLTIGEALSKAQKNISDTMGRYKTKAERKGVVVAKDPDTGETVVMPKFAFLVAETAGKRYIKLAELPTGRLAVQQVGGAVGFTPTVRIAVSK